MEFNKTTSGEPINFIIKNKQAFIEATRLQKKAIKKYINQSFILVYKNKKLVDVGRNSGAW